jgi:hypothetical protein
MKYPSPLLPSTLAAFRIPAAFATANFLEKQSDAAHTMMEN